MNPPNRITHLRFFCRQAMMIAMAIQMSISQSLDIPDRSPGSLNGDQIVAQIRSLSRQAREERLYQEILAGNIPEFMRALVPVTSSGVVSGSTKTITYFVTPDYLAVGSDENYFLSPMTPILAQRIADAIGCILPTRKMVNSIYTAAPLKLAPAPIPPSAEMITVPVFARHDSIVWAQRSPQLATHPLGTLVGGTKKDVVISNRIRNDLRSGVPKPVVIYGWHQLNGSPIQPLYNGHGETYADYSHGIRLVLDSVTVDDVATTITAVLQDPLLSVVLSDEGVISAPRYGDVPTSVEEREEGAMKGAALFNTFPNPFNPGTTIQYGLLSEAHVRLAVYDVLGREVKILVDTIEQAGWHSVRFDGSQLASGVYVCRIEAGSVVGLKKMLLVR